MFTLFTVAVTPVYPAFVVPEKAPGSDPAVWVAAVVVLSNPFARVALLESGHFGPVHAPAARLGHVYGSPVEAVLSAAPNAVGERQDDWRGDAAGITVTRSQNHGYRREQRHTHVRFPQLWAADNGENVSYSSADGFIMSAASLWDGSEPRVGKTAQMDETAFAWLAEQAPLQGGEKKIH